MSNRTEIKGDHWGQQREDSEDHIKVELYRVASILFSFPLCKNLSCFLKQKASS